MLDRIDRCHSLADLLSLRSSLRQQQIALQSALAEVQAELGGWRQERRQRQGQQLPADLSRLWQELAERERQLALDLLQLRHLAEQVNGEIHEQLQRRRSRAG